MNTDKRRSIHSFPHCYLCSSAAKNLSQNFQLDKNHGVTEDLARPMAATKIPLPL